MKGFCKRLLGVCLCLCLLMGGVCSVAAVPAEEGAFAVRLTGGARVGEPLTAEAENVPAGCTVVYTWKVGGELIAGTGASYTPAESDLFEMIEVTAAAVDGKTIETAAARAFCSDLPVIYIDTEGGQAVTSKEDYLTAHMVIQGGGEYPDETFDGITEIRGRGNSTWTMYPKKPYKLKLDEKTDLFGMGKNKHWVLLANYRDRALLRGKLAMDLSGAFGMEYMQSVYVDLVLNGEYVGNYQLCEQIRVGSTRVDIFDWEEAAEDAGGEAEDLSALTTENGYDLTGGYLMELNGYYDEVSKFMTEAQVPFTFKSPEYANTNPEMMAYVQGYLQDFEDAVLSDDYYNDKGRHYSELFDMDSLVDWWLVNEFTMNADSGTWSAYMYKDVGGDLFHMGPVWDFDSSLGNYVDHGMQLPYDQWRDGQQGTWYKALIGDPWFVSRLQSRYWEMHEAFENLLTQMEAYHDVLERSAGADHAVWGIPTTFEYEYELLYDWIENRIRWMDEQFATVESALSSLGEYGEGVLTLDAADAAGDPLPSDDTDDPALLSDAQVGPGGAVSLSVTSPVQNTVTAAVYLNGLRIAEAPLIDGRAAFTLDAGALPAGERAVVQVRAYDREGNLIGSRFLTLRASAVPGDVNGDGLVNSSDARLVLQYTVELTALTSAQLAAADVDGNGQVNSSDARRMLQTAVQAAV